ncbi:hypothetical protein K2224_14705 [Streptomyces sp. BHT-5-2]|uniref:hypothetical protein n=1 Tax=Streptomyces sp. BHT-5-2 TaxID=2866715 RepID=UPI001C8D54E2|nr:hypothetical protein [Streptomyces sp. BHT-5-2]QZL04275.1 hypothetical protein K2224_14705 [Streptomyces sp. BHT-5-2]
MHVNSGWRDPRSGQVFEVQSRTPQIRAAPPAAHKLYEERRRPSIGPERARELQKQPNAIFTAYRSRPCAERLNASVHCPAGTRPPAGCLATGPDRRRAGGRRSMNPSRSVSSRA